MGEALNHRASYFCSRCVRQDAQFVQRILDAPHRILVIRFNGDQVSKFWATLDASINETILLCRSFLQLFLLLKQYPINIVCSRTRKRKGNGFINRAPTPVNRASLNVRRAWYIGQLLYKEAIHVGEEAVSHSLIIEIVPGCELVDLNIHA